MGTDKESDRALYQEGVMMETIRNYLESMFARLPNTPEVIRAKCELGQMMEDKYTELISEGRSDNEAVAQVISEFGNLDELGEALGISQILHDQRAAAISTRQVTEEEANAFIRDSSLCGLIRGLGVFFAIISASGVILASAAPESDSTYMVAGLIFLFCSIAACVALCTYSTLRMGRWSFLKYEPCSIDYSTAGMMNDARNRLHDTIILQRTIAVLLLCVCYVPLVVLSMLNTGDEDIYSLIGVVILLFLVGFAVLILISSAARESSYVRLLRLNSRQRMEGHYYKEQDEVYYENPKLRAFMSVYWPTVTCVYLIISFLTFAWAISWIIWPVAALINTLINNLCGTKREG